MKINWLNSEQKKLWRTVLPVRGHHATRIARRLHAAASPCKAALHSEERKKREVVPAPHGCAAPPPTPHSRRATTPARDHARTVREAIVVLTDLQLMHRHRPHSHAGRKGVHTPPEGPKPHRTSRRPHVGRSNLP